MTPLTAGNIQKTPSLSDRLNEAHRLLETGSYPDALNVVKNVKALDPRNVYVLAFEKQLEQLIEYGDANILTDEQRTDILESIPGIIERAIEGVAVEQFSAERAPSAPAPPSSRDDKAAALEWLKDQYFQHAHEYVKNEQYEHALAEIRRVYIIDANNEIAREFEKRIEHLRNLKKEPQTQPVPTPPPLRLVTKESLANEESVNSEEAEVVEPEVPLPRENEPVPVEADDSQSPAISASRLPMSEAPVAKGRTQRTFVTVVLLLAILAAGATIYLLWMRSQSAKRAEQRRPTVISNTLPETFIGAPVTAEEQQYTVSSESQESESPIPQVSEDVSTQTDKPELKEPEKPANKGAPRTFKGPAEKPKPSPIRKTSETPAQNTVVTTAVSTHPELLSRKAETPPTTLVKNEQTAAPEPILEKQAEIIRLERPRFSESAYAAGLGGQVFVQVQIDSDGKPIQTRVLKSTNQLLEGPVVDAIMKSRYSPAQMSSGPVSSWMTIPFKFTSK